jgi:hypothetical protein
MDVPSKGACMFKSQTCLVFEDLSFKWLVMQTAATVLYICEQRSPSNQFGPGERADEKHDPIEIKLSAYENWAENGFTNALQTQVSLIYDFISLVLSDRNYLNVYLFEQNEPRLLTDALIAYQAWKTAKIAADKARYGEHWGDASPFNRKDWTDQNERFLAMFSNWE